LVHQGTRQIMLDDNSPYGEYGGYDPYLMEIFKTYFPDLYCPKHEPNGELRNKICSSECNTGGCCDDLVKCGSCSNTVCFNCGKQCKTCEITFCEDCIVEECHNADCRINGKPGYLCKEDYESCDCGRPMCVDHQEECDTCGLHICSECAKKCYQCNLWACPDHYFECAGCNEDEKCENCVSLDFKGEFGEFDPLCHICEDKFCISCLKKCIRCEKNTCDSDSCFDEETSLCSECSEEDDEDDEDYDDDDEDDED